MQTLFNLPTPTIFKEKFVQSLSQPHRKTIVCVGSAQHSKKSFHIVSEHDKIIATVPRPINI